MASDLSQSRDHDASAGRQLVNLSLDADLLSRVLACTPDLSAIVEQLLGAYLDAARRRQQDVDRVIDAVNDLHSQGRWLSDEFSAL